MRRQTKPETLAICHECDLLQRQPKLSPGDTARCSRCGASLYRYPKRSLDTQLALNYTALILFIIANLMPFMSLEIEGRIEETTLAGASWALYQADRWWLALIVLFTSVVGPAIIILSGLYVLTSIRWQARFPWTQMILRAMSHLRPWGMLDVFMIGVLVSLVKLSDMADVLVGSGLYAFMALLLVSAAIASQFEPKQLWDKISAS